MWEVSMNFPEFIKNLQEFYDSCSEDEKVLLDASAIVASTKLSKVSQLVVVGEMVDKVLRSRKG
jgi:hypothetical protein